MGANGSPTGPGPHGRATVSCATGPQSPGGDGCSLLGRSAPPPKHNAPPVGRDDTITMIDVPDRHDKLASTNAKRGKGKPFEAGNPGGPGNPLARQQAQLRAALVAAVSLDDIKAIAKGMIDGARSGDAACMNALLRYAIGEPTKGVSVEYSGPRLASLRAATLEAIAADCGMTEADDEGR